VAALSQTRRNVTLLVALLFAQLLLMSGSVKGGEGATLLESWTLGITSPVVSVSRWISGGFRGLVQGTRELFETRSRNDELEQEVARLRAEMRLRREAAAENTRLRRLLGMRDELDARSIGASVVTSSLTGQTKMFVVDRGTRHGVSADLPVIAGGGAVGRVVVAYARHSKVRLLTDPNSGVAGVTQRGRAQGVVLGQGAGPLALLYVPRFSDVLAGDRVVTSGLDGIFPRGFGIGQVASVEEDPSGTQTILLQPELDYRGLEEVMILLESPGGRVLEEPQAVEDR